MRLIPASLADLDHIMRLEAEGFAPGIRETRAVYAERLATFPQGALLAMIGSDCGGCIFTEMWPEQKRFAADDFALGHDIRARHDARRGTTLYIASMTLAPAWRGKGLGEKLLNGGIARVADSYPALRSALLLVNVQWAGAHAIYRNAGFAEIARFPAFFRPHADATADGIVMQKRLLPAAVPGRTASGNSLPAAQGPAGHA